MADQTRVKKMWINTYDINVDFFQMLRAPLYQIKKLT